MPISPRRRLLLSAALLTLAGLAAGCSTGSTGASGRSGTPVTGGTLAVGLTSDPSCLDPQQTSQLTALEISRALVDTLTDQDAETGRIVPWLAESFSVAADARRFSFVLRAGATFSDGTPVDAAAVKATFDRLSTLPGNGAPAFLRGYTGTTVTDARHLTVSFADPNAQFLQATSGTGFGVLSKGTAAKSLEDRCRGDFTGSGPYVLDHYTSNQEVVLRRRADYRWPSSLASNRGPAYLDQVRFLFIAEAGARTGALRSGQVQIGENVQPIDQSQFDGTGFRLLARSSPGLVPPLSLNQRGILTDQRVREALLKGIDRRELVDTALSPRFRPATGPLSSTTPFYVDLSAKLRFDPGGAKDLLDGAGWTPGPDGIRVKDGHRLTLEWLVPAPMPQPDEYVQQQLRRIGVDVRMNIVPAARYSQLQQAGDFDITAVAVTRADPDVLRTVFSTEGENLWHLPPSELDTYLRQQASATTVQARQEAVTKAATWLLDHADTIPLYENAQVHGVSVEVRNLDMDASLRLDLHDAWLG
jgi:peptide/nickel transport system substrate-binding protein